ncbi:Uncharacterised protein [Vibrio cholerae]|uniref:Uncharacterized protein n=1 Tax=Vibrio cholerae TaxID=666 RepID=A0A655UU50_VIBCL|nr:Uncharacterised protein [Vibrio cholerae]CSB35472.1 Uncharacterised protein [Vibrio cholerae]CSB37077.1 Uncharacterised protein [Vibrio cholerae]CSB55576.1 Uncharacterised protein [Vibrio cholerae]CSB76759.1 Uncharacterised protein [Vibrio cholerae]
MSFKYRNVGMVVGVILQGRLHRHPCGISSMQNTAMAVTAFAGQVVAWVVVIAVLFFVKRYTAINQPLHALFGMLGNKAHGLFITNPSTCN